MAVDALSFAGLTLLPNAISLALVKIVGGGSACPVSSLQPPGYVFAIAWTILYIMYGVCMALVNKNRHYGVLVKLFLLLAGLNVWWLLFGPSCMPGLALAGIVILLVACICVVHDLFRKHKLAAGLLVPLCGWLAFATILSIQQVQILYRI